MVVSDSHTFIFVHIRKAAGGSIRDSLLPLSITPANDISSKIKSRILNIERNYQKFSFRHHSPIVDAIKLMPKELFDSYFKFAFVRNPYTRLISEYEFIRRRPDHGRHRKVIKMSFDQYIRFQSKRFDAHQVNMLTDAQGNLQMDFIGRFENLHQDWALICDRLALKNAELSHRKKAVKVNLIDYYNKENIKLVARLWKADLEAFEYEYPD
ncbi:sulfotransferase family 2 domain-containing protein [Lutimonas sp.]|uniref:sulfotransferase family 2 domain-containing protein n=1 Tax=Lutimonas sp. TaxID=1872403 RepID=UPI003D9B4EE1